jgi:ABC-2 type transport system ATP-binding protein
MTAAARPAASSAGPVDIAPRLRVDGLSRRFGTRVALDGVSFEVAPGELFGLLGPNGAGKTTAFRLLAACCPRTAARWRWMGAPSRPTTPPIARAWASCSRRPSLDLKLTARENLRLGRALYGVPRAIAARRIDEALALMALGDRADEPASKYSGGMRRRIEIARVLLHEPSLLLLDEPGRGVDPEALRRIWDEIGGWRRRARPASS